MTVQEEKVATAWGMACDLRRVIENEVVQEWPEFFLSDSEYEQLEKLKAHLWEARECARELQRSLSRRSADGGLERPDFNKAREGRI